MRGRTIIMTAAIAATTAVAMLAVDGHADRRLPNAGDRGVIGPDVVAWAIGGQNSEDIDYVGSSEGMSGYSMATVSCNWGDTGLNWYGNSNNTPVIMQNMFRLKDGKFEQVGIQSFMKHSFCALSEPGCGECQASDCDTLGVGCADTYWAGLNAGGNVPRSDVNAFTGEYPYPFTHSPSGPTATRGNLVAPSDDVDPALNEGAQYFMEAMYVAADDTAAGNGDNNASWREIEFESISNPNVLVNGPADTHAGECAIEAWSQMDPSVRTTTTHVPDEGKVIVAVKYTDNLDGTWTYDYAIYNMNSDRSIRSVSVPKGTAEISSQTFRDIDHNSGEIYDGTNWNMSVSSDAAIWETETYSENELANALRWGTMFNYSIVATAAPEAGTITLGLFKPGGPDSFEVSTFIPAGEPVDPCDLPVGYCPEDVDGDSIVAVGDLLAIVGEFGECGDGTYRPAGDVTGNCCVDVSDVLAVVNAWGNDCTPVGACCLPKGGCDDSTTEANCVMMDGNYFGDDTNCEQANCPDLSACCFDDGGCAEVLPADCATLGGAPQGNGTYCASTECPVAGAGDECSGAFIASMGANSFETNSATPSENPPSDAQCQGTYLEWDNSADIWFRYDASQSGNVNFTTCDPDSFDTSIALYEGSCDNQVNCNGDADGSGCQAYHSEMDYNVEAGTTYYIRVGGWQGSTGSGTLTIQ